MEIRGNLVYSLDLDQIHLTCEVYKCFTTKTISRKLIHSLCTNRAKVDCCEK